MVRCPLAKSWSCLFSGMNMVLHVQQFLGLNHSGPVENRLFFIKVGMDFILHLLHFVSRHLIP